MYKKHTKIKQSLYFPKSLTEAFNDILDYPLTVVIAPSGYGKTTAVREKIIGMDANILWQSVYDDSKTEFWNGFCRLFIELDEEYANNLMQLGLPEDSSSLYIVLTFIYKMVLDKHTIIVIDNFHLIETPETVNFITYLVLNEIVNLNIVLVSRFIKYLKIEELLLKGYLIYIKKEKFEFIKKDIITYFQLCDITLTNEEANELYILTNGWISILYLIMLNYKNTGKLLLSLDIYKLIEEISYEPFSNNCKKFLLTMSVYDGFTREMAKNINPKLDTDKIIDEITLQTVFLAYDPIRKLYYTHAIFTNFLSNKLGTMTNGFKEKLYKKACRWYLQKKEYVIAMRYSFLGNDWDMLLLALSLDKGGNINGEHKDILIKYYESCSYESKKNNILAVIFYARHMITFNEVVRFKNSCDELMTIIEDTEFSDPLEKNKFLAERELLLTLTEYNDIDKMTIYVKRASEFSKEPSSIYNDSSPYTFGSPSFLYLYYRQSGFLINQVHTLCEALPLYNIISGNQAKGADEIMRSEYFYFTGDFQNAEIHMHKAYQKIKSEANGLLICAIFLDIKLSFIKGNLINILQLFKKLRDIYKIKLYVFVQTIDLCEAYIFSLLHMSEKINPWIKNGEFDNIRLFAPALGFVNIVYAKVLFESGEYLKLIGISEQFLRTANIFPNILGQIYTYIFLGQAYSKIQRYNEALIALKKGLDLAIPDKVYMPFVENYDFLEFLFDKLYNQGIYTNEISKINEIHNIFSKSKEKMINEYLPEKNPSLTKREKEIANLASQGFSNKEISKQLFISENTIKTQLKSIYMKLNINSRYLLKQKL